MLSDFRHNNKNNKLLNIYIIAFDDHYRGDVTGSQGGRNMITKIKAIYQAENRNDEHRHAESQYGTKRKPHFYEILKAAMRKINT